MSGSFVVSLQTGGGPITCAADPQQVAAVPVALFSQDSKNESRIAFEGSRISQFHFPSPRSSSSSGTNTSSSVKNSPHSFRQTVVIQGAGVCFDPSNQSDACSGILSALRHVEEECVQRLSAAARAEWLAALRAQQHQQAKNTESLRTVSSCQTPGSNASSNCRSFPIKQLEALGPARARYVSEVRAALSQRCRWSSCLSVKLSSASFSLVLHSEAFGLLLFCRDKLGLSSLLALGPHQPISGREKITLTPSAVHLETNLQVEQDIKNRPAVEVPIGGLWIIDLWKWAHLNESELRADSSGMENEENQSSKQPHKQENQNSQDNKGNQDFSLDIWGAFCLPWEKPSVIRSEHVWCSCKSCETLRYGFWRERGGVSSFCATKIINEILDDFHFSGSPSSLSQHEKRGECMQISEMKCTELNITSAHVISALYRHLSVAVCRAIAEALHHIHSTYHQKAESADPTYIGILFSGGVDSSLIAGLVLRSLAVAMARASGLHAPCPTTSSESVERCTTQLLYECSCSSGEPARLSTDSHDLKGGVVVELVCVCFSAEAPDRLTALRSFQDLLKLLRGLGVPCHPIGEDGEVCSCVIVGHWALELRLLAVDVSPEESMQCRKQLLRAIFPKRSHMDFNIAAPLFFASRGAGYLVSPGFSNRAEWKKLRDDAALWRELIIRPPPLPRFCRSKPIPIQSSREAIRCMQEKGRSTHDGVAINPCRICSRQAKEGCAHAACKLCCEKLRAVAAATDVEEKFNLENACIYVGGKGKVPISAIGFKPQNTCPVHRNSHKMRCFELSIAGKDDKKKERINPNIFSDDLREKERTREKRNSIEDEKKKRTDEEINANHDKEGRMGIKNYANQGEEKKRVGEKVGSTKYISSRPAPFESLEKLPCGVPLATCQKTRPFFAMSPTEMKRWCLQQKLKEKDCFDPKTATYTLQSRVLLMGSGADELFGGYGRHRTANLTRGWEALRKEQIVDLERLWLRNMGRDARVLDMFNRVARFPFLDETLLLFVCNSVPFEHIVKPAPDLHAEAEAVLEELQKKCLGLDGIEEDIQSNACTREESSSQESHVPQEDVEEGGEDKKEINPGLHHISEVMTPSKQERMDNVSGLCCGNKWLLRLIAFKCGLTFSAIAKKRAMQFGSRSAKASNKECFPSNRKARGDAQITAIIEKEESEEEIC